MAASLLSTPAFLRRAADGVSIDLRVQPRARRTALTLSSGALKASVSAPPEDGKANDAVLALLSAAWRVPRSTLAVIKGMSARDKTVKVSGDPALLAARIEKWTREQEMDAHG